MLRWTIEDKIGYRNLFGKRLVPVRQVDYLVQYIGVARGAGGPGPPQLKCHQ